jgi:hypothetical protein
VGYGWSGYGRGLGLGRRDDRAIDQAEFEERRRSLQA